jgi:hypothetical protein
MLCAGSLPACDFVGQAFCSFSRSRTSIPILLVRQIGFLTVICFGGTRDFLQRRQSKGFAVVFLFFFSPHRMTLLLLGLHAT